MSRDDPQRSTRRKGRPRRKPLSYLPSSPPGVNMTVFPVAMTATTPLDENSAPPWSLHSYDAFSSPPPLLSQRLSSSPIPGRLARSAAESPSPSARKWAHFSSPAKRQAGFALDEPFQPLAPFSSPAKRSVKRQRVSLVVLNGRATVSSLLQDSDDEPEYYAQPASVAPVADGAITDAELTSMKPRLSVSEETASDASVALRQTMARLQTNGGSLPGSVFMSSLDAVPNTPRMTAADLDCFTQSTPSRLLFGGGLDESFLNLYGAVSMTPN